MRHLIRDINNTKISLGKEVKDYRQQFENLEILYRDKDKECRLLTLKLKELQRVGRFGKLKPLDLDLVNTSAMTGRAQSSMRNNYDPFNPKPKQSVKVKKDEINYSSDKPKRNKLSISRLYDAKLNNITLDPAKDIAKVTSLKNEGSQPALKRRAVSRNLDSPDQEESDRPRKIRPKADSLVTDDTQLCLDDEKSKKGEKMEK